VSQVGEGIRCRLPDRRARVGRREPYESGAHGLVAVLSQAADGALANDRIVVHQQGQQGASHGSAIGKPSRNLGCEGEIRSPKAIRSDQLQQFWRVVLGKKLEHRFAGLAPPIGQVSGDSSVVDEIHAIREAMAKASDNDLRKIAEAARARQGASGRQVVTLPPRQASAAKKAS
jgi:hypothetical protein